MRSQRFTSLGLVRKLKLRRMACTVSFLVELEGAWWVVGADGELRRSLCFGYHLAQVTK